MPLNNRLGGPLTEAGSLSPAEGLGVCLGCEPETVTAILSGLGAPGLSAPMPVATGHTRAQATHEGQEPDSHCGAMGAQLGVSCQCRGRYCDYNHLAEASWQRRPKPH